MSAVFLEGFAMKQLCQQVVEAAKNVHAYLGGPGLLETIYECALCHELSLKGFSYQRQLPIPVLYKGVVVRDPLFLDILVESKLIVEVKATPKDFPFYQAQLLTHLRMTGTRCGLLINFGKADLKEGISFVINDRVAEPIHNE
jgi:GxxExxY protein